MSSFRLPVRGVFWIWTLFLLLCVAVTLPRVWWHIQLFRIPGPLYYHLLLILAPLLVALPLVYSRIRARGFSQYEWPVLSGLILTLWLFRQPRATLVAAAFLGGCHAIGRLVLRLSGVPMPSFWALLGLRLTAGMGVYSLVLYGLGAAGLLNPVVFAVLLSPAVLDWRGLREAASTALREFRAWPEKTQAASPLFDAVVFFLGLFALFTALSALTPTTNGDALRMHLSLAKDYLQTGRLTPPPFLPYGFFPQGFEVLMTMLWGLGGQSAAEMLHPLQFAVCVMVLYAVARECGFSRTAALTGIVVGITVPLIHWDGSVVKNDVACALYLLATLLSLLLIRGNSFARAAGLSAFFLACAFGIKLTALFGAVPLVLLLAKRIWQMPRHRLRAGALALALFAAVALGWYLRTWIAKGDPTYPESLGRVANPAFRLPTWTAYALRYVLLPYRLHFHGRENFESPTDNPLGFALVFLSPLLLLLRSRGDRPLVSALWFFVAVYLFFWSSFIWAVRYAIAAFLVLGLLLGDRLEAVSQAPSRALRAFALGTLVYCGVFSTLVTIILEMYPHEPAFLARAIDRKTFLRGELPPFGAIDFLNGRAGPGDLVLDIGGWAVSYAPFPGNIYEVYRKDRKYLTGDVNDLANRPYKYLILPDATNTPELEQAAARVRSLTVQYDDGNFRVYRLQ